jgi:hypothetical protein
MNYFTPAIGNGDVADQYRKVGDRYHKLQRELAMMPATAYPARRSGVEELIELLHEAHAWRMRLIELTLASIVFFWLGFFIAVRCL